MNKRQLFIQRVLDFEARLRVEMHRIMCPVHLSTGHEEVAADIYEHIHCEDWLFSTHRNHHHYLAKHGSEQKLFDEIMGLRSGVNGGFSGSQSISDESINFHASAIVGGLVGVATGTALALKLDGSSAIVVCCMGDAGTEGGVFWESMNFAALHSLPIAYICENNGKSVDSTIDERQATSIRQRVAAFGVGTYDSVAEAIQSARRGIPGFHEAHVTLQAAHLNMATMLDRCPVPMEQV